MALFGNGFTGTPDVGFGLSDTAREFRMGWSLNSAMKGDDGASRSVSTPRRSTASASASLCEHAMHGGRLHGTPLPPASVLMATANIELSTKVG